MENLPQEQRKQRLIQSKPSEKGEIITYLSRMGDVLHNVLERSKIILALVAVHTVGNSHQPNIMEREKFLGQLADLNVVAPQPGKVFDEHRRDVPSLDSGQHLLKTGTLHRRTRDTVIHEEDRVGIALVLGGLLKYLPLRRDLSRVFSS